MFSPVCPCVSVLLGGKPAFIGGKPRCYGLRTTDGMTPSPRVVDFPQTSLPTHPNHYPCLIQTQRTHPSQRTTTFTGECGVAMFHVKHQPLPCPVHVPSAINVCLRQRRFLLSTSTTRKKQHPCRSRTLRLRRTCAGLVLHRPPDSEHPAVGSDSHVASGSGPLLVCRVFWAWSRSSPSHR